MIYVCVYGLLTIGIPCYCFVFAFVCFLRLRVFFFSYLVRRCFNIAFRQKESTLRAPYDRVNGTGNAFISSILTHFSRVWRPTFFLWREAEPNVPDA